jgi:hypothetical protein
MAENRDRLSQRFITAGVRLGLWSSAMQPSD